MPKSRYQTGLGDTFLTRMRVIFLVLIAIVFLSSGTAIYAGVKTGQLERVFVQPAKDFITSWQKIAEESDRKAAETESILNYIATSSAETNVKTNNSVKVNTKTNQNNQTQKSTGQTNPNTYIPAATPITYPTYDTKSLQEEIREMNEKADKEYQEALKRQDAWAEQKSAENQKWFEEAKQKQLEDLEQWKKEHGF